MIRDGEYVYQKVIKNYDASVEIFKVFNNWLNISIFVNNLIINRKRGFFMPRCARIKSYDSVYHIMIRSINEVPLFIENTDKDTYLSLIKKYQVQYGFKLYSYCLMDNHGH